MKSSYQVGRNLLGPIIYKFCYQLWVNQHAWHDRDAIALFLSRGGIRLRYFYQQFLEVNSIEAPLPIDDYYISRMASMKANFLQRPEEIAAELVKEFNYWSVHDAMGALLPWHVFEPWWNALDEVHQERYRIKVIAKDVLTNLIADSQPGHEYLREYFDAQKQLARRHLDEIRQGKNEIILVDTGWSGSILAMIQGGFTDISFMGHFFGRYAYGEEWKPWFSHLIGIGVEDKVFRWSKPHTSLFQHRHLIEGMCEPVWPSVEWYVIDDDGQVTSQAGPIPPERVAPSDEEPFAQGVVDYIRYNSTGLNAYSIHSKAHKASRRLRRLVCFPRISETSLMTVETRSADFGKNLDVPVLIETGNKTKLKDRIANIRTSLWPEAQIAREFPFSRLPIQLMYLFVPNRFNKLLDWLDKRLS